MFVLILVNWKEKKMFRKDKTVIEEVISCDFDIADKSVNSLWI